MHSCACWNRGIAIFDAKCMPMVTVNRCQLRMGFEFNSGLASAMEGLKA